MGKRADRPAVTLSETDLVRYQDARRKKIADQTVNKEVTTIQGLCRWAIAKKYLEQSPAEELELFKCEVDLDPFKTVAEIEQIIGRG